MALVVTRLRDGYGPKAIIAHLIKAGVPSSDAEVIVSAVYERYRAAERAAGKRDVLIGVGILIGIIVLTLVFNSVSADRRYYLVPTGALIAVVIIIGRGISRFF